MNLFSITPENLMITTSRLQLSLMTIDDFDNFKSLQSNAELMKYIGPILSDDELNTKFIERIKPFTQEEDHWLTLNIHEKKNLTFIGSIGFKLDSINDQRFEIGYLALKHYSGKGYITEAGLAIIDFLFKQIKVKKIVAHCVIENIASWKVMDKLGLLREGELKSDFFLNNIWYDGYAYGLVNTND